MNKVALPDKVIIRNFSHETEGYPRMGNINCTFITNNTVFQVGLVLRDKISQQAESILERYVLDTSDTVDKNGSLKLTLYKARIDEIRESLKKQLAKCIVIPAIRYNVDNVKTIPLNFPHWERDFVRGTPLDLSHSSVVQIVLSFLNNLHKIRNISSLREYYEMRLEAFKYIMDTGEVRIPESDHSRLSKYLKQSLDNISFTIDKTERATLVHGDFLASHIFEGDKIGIFDFEQGLMGGDPLVDLYKLLSLHTLATETSRSSLISRRRNYWLKKHLNDYKKTFDLFKRIDLIKMDQILSTLILRHFMGWNFNQSRNQRGVFFLEYLLKRALELTN